MSDEQSPGAYPTGALPPNIQLQGRYTIKRRLGQGGMGSVYLAHDTRLDIECAIKEMSTSLLKDDAERASAIKSFHEEAKLLARLSHANLPRVTDHFSEDGKEYLVMEYVPGETLGSIMRDKPPPWEIKDVLEIAEPLTEVLHYLHSRKPAIIFRDLKPANVIRTPEGEIKLIDFGIARLFKPGQSHDTQAFGTMGYSAPEQYGQGQTDARSDVYSLAILLHQLATGFDPVVKPFGIPQAYTLNPNVPQGLSNAIQHGMSHDPEDRFGSMQAFWRALRSQADAKPAVAPTYVAGPTQAVNQQAPMYGVAPGTPPQRPPSAPMPPQSPSVQPARPPSGPIGQPYGQPPSAPMPGPARPPSQPYGQPQSGPIPPAYGQPPSAPMPGPARPPSQPYGQPQSGPMPPAYGQPPSGQMPPVYGQPPSGPMPPVYGQPGFGPPSGQMPPVVAQPFAASGQLPRAESTGLAKTARGCGLAGIGLAIAALFSNSSEDLTVLFGSIGLLLSVIGFIVSLISLASEQRTPSLKGRQHATIGLGLSIGTFVLACFAIALAFS
ncbi:MAG TPA: protein kinase [Herpetosiphonaceae bacterium]